VPPVPPSSGKPVPPGQKGPGGNVPGVVMVVPGKQVDTMVDTKD